MKANWKNKTIWTGDNLPIMRGMNSESVDLIYLDPPFNSKTDYAAPIGSKAAGAAFKDTWTLSDVDVEWVNLIEEKHPRLHRVLLAAMTDSDKSYLIYMAARLLEMRRVLKPTGSIYLHCDPTMSHYLKTVMDSIFGHGNFRSDITWRRTNAKGLSFKGFPNNADSLLYYSKSDDYVWDRVYRPHSTDYINNFYRYTDENGRRYRISDLTNPNRNRPNLTYEWNGHLRVWRWTKERMQEAHNRGIIHYSSTGLAAQKRYLDEMAGVPVDTIWDDIKPVQAQAKERTGYPTQKPLALLGRIIKASSNEGDIVLDPFCGCATTLAAADRLKRSWLGIDISPKAAELVVRRITAQQGLWRNIIHRTDILKRTDIGKLPPYNSQSNRQKLYGIQEGNCAGCNTHFEARHLEVDHIISRSNGGTDHIENLQLLCGNCNRVKGDRGMEYLKAKLQIGG